MKYVVHCSPHMDGTEDYLTPTQRANRQIRRLKVIIPKFNIHLLINIEMVVVE
jgi:hypothetical protein